MFVKPAPGRMVRDPISKRHLPGGGAEVPATNYWLRRLDAGDVVAAEPPKPAPMLKPTKGEE